MKKIIRILLTAVALLVIFQAAALAEGETWNWTLEEGVLTITGTGEITSNPWKSKSSTANQVQEIVIGDGITGITETYAFSKMSNLRKVTLPPSLTTIGKGAFYQCSKLETVILQGQLASIGEYAFYQCSALVSCDLPNRLTSIGQYAFYMCGKLTGIVLPDSLASIGYRAFTQCESLVSITIPDGVQSIGEGNFDYTDVLIYAKTGTDGAKALGAAGYGYYETAERKYMLRYTQPDVLEIYDADKDITELRIPEAVTRIGKEAFKDCSKLQQITLLALVTEIGEKAFSGCAALTSVNLPDGLKKLGQSCFYNCESLAQIKLPQGLTTIERGAFERSGLTEIHIPDSVTTLGWEVFRLCEGLKTATLSSKLTEIPKSLFDSTALESIILPDAVETIGEYAFMSCANLQSATLPAGLKSIGGCGFAECKKLAHIDLPAGLTEIGFKAFDRCSGLTGTITIPQGITAIPEAAFRGCSGLDEIVLPDGLTSVGESGLACRNVVIRKLPESLTSFGERAFEGAKIPEGIHFPGGMSEIPAYAFYGCTLPAHLTIPSNIHNIWDNAFAYTNISSVTFDGQCAPGIEAFRGCRSLSIVCFLSGSSTNRIGENCFDDCVSLQNVYINTSAGTARIEYHGDDSGKAADKGNNPLRNASWHFGESYRGEFDPKDAWSVSYTWNEENQTVTGTRLCTNNSKHKQEETVSYTVTIVTPPTGTEPGEALYTSGTFSNPAFTTQYKTVVLDPVPVPAEEIRLNKTKATMTRTSKKQKPTLQLKATVLPEDTTDIRVTWKSSNKKIATVDEYGKVTALKAGTVTITCTAKDGSGVKATCKITVKDRKLTKITLNKKKLTLRKGASAQLKVSKFTPATALNRKVTWKSSNKKIAKVTSGGKITAVKPGKATITCTAKDGSGVKAVCTVTVTAAKGAGLDLPILSAAEMLCLWEGISPDEE